MGDNHKKIQFVADLTQQALSATNSSLEGATAISQVNVADTKKTYDPEIEMATAMMKLMEKIITEILDSLSGNTDDLQDVKQLFNSILSKMARTVDGITSQSS